MLKIASALDPNLECPDGAKLVKEEKGRMQLKYCTGENGKKVGNEKKLMNVGGEMKVYYHRNHDKPEEVPMKATYSKKGHIVKLSNGRFVYNIKYNNKGEIIQIIAKNVKTGEKVSLGSSLDNTSSEVKGCEGAEINEATQEILCPDGRVFKLDNDSLNATSRSIIKQIESGRGITGEERKGGSAVIKK